MNWTLKEAWQLFVKLQPEARRCGYLLSIFGSVIERGEGNDLDLVAVPISCEALAGQELARKLACVWAHDVIAHMHTITQSPRVLVPRATGWQIADPANRRVDLLVIGR